MPDLTPLATRLEEAEASRRANCERCEGRGWYWRTPDGFNPFSAGGWSTIKAMYKTPCGHTPFLAQSPEATNAE